MSAINLLTGLLKEVAPENAGRFRLSLVPRKEEEFYSLEDGEHDSIKLTASTPSALAAGAHHFLREKLNFHWSWCGDTPAREDHPVKVGQPVRHTLPLPLRPYLNYCTFGYSTVWWDWKRWKREIDFMALNGINLPMAVTGLEMVWLKTLRRFGLSDEEILQFISGPAFLPWQFMMNMDSHAGPMPMTWIEGHAELGQKIVRRELEWGMKPILPGYNGQVPAAFMRRFPKANYITNGGWCNFPPVHMLNPADPLFGQVSRVFLEELTGLFGTTHYYSIDLFHEQAAPDESPEYLSSCGRSLAENLIRIDPQAIWVMQAWSERKEIIQAIPEGHLLMLDIGKEKLEATKGMYGVPTVWGTIHNFGGQTEIGGNLETIPQTIAQRRKDYKNLVGAGTFPEGIENNPVLFQLVFDSALMGGDLELKPWLRQYLENRYGKTTEKVREAWDWMLRLVYAQRRGDSIFAARPGLDIDRSNAWAGFRAEDTPLRFFLPWGKLLDAASELAVPTEGFLFDVIDLGRQAFSALGMSFFQQCKKAFHDCDETTFRKTGDRFLTLMEDCDRLLACHPIFRLDRWTDMARAWGKTPREKDFYEWNARLIVTLWGPVKQPEPLFDYCGRVWSGLLSEYQEPRWKRFFDYAQERLEQGKDLGEASLPRLGNRFLLESNDFYTNLYHDVEEPFPKRHDLKSTPPHPVPLQLARELYDKYLPFVKLEDLPENGPASASDLVAGFEGNGPVVL